MKKLKELDLTEIVKLAVRNMYSSLDERRDYLPFFTYRLFDNPIFVEHGAFESPHVVGRYLYAFSWAAKSFGIEIRKEIIEALKRRLFHSFDIGKKAGTGLSWNEDTGKQVPGAWGHNQREALLGLLGLVHLLGLEEALDLASSLVRDISKYAHREGVLPGSYLTEKGWQKEKYLIAPPAQSGRMVRALLDYYKLSGDIAALDLAIKLATYNAKTCFEGDGSWKDSAGMHIHSITGTITSIIDLGLYLHDDFLINRGRLAFDNGLKPYRSSFGWVQERRGTEHERGEANNSSDILQTAILLAKYVDSNYWDDAEIILRNHLIASQLTDSSLFKDSAGCTNTLDVLYSGVAERSLGGFCFSSPCNFKSHKEDREPINTDLVGGATHGICEAFSSIFQDSGLELRINLLVSGKNEICNFKSHLPVEGRLELIVNEPRNVLIHLPSSIKKANIKVTVNNKIKKVVWIGDYLCLCERPIRLTSEIEFSLIRESTTEILNGKEYRIDWLGNTVLSVKGPELFFKELY